MSQPGDSTRSSPGTLAQAGKRLRVVPPMDSATSEDRGSTVAACQPRHGLQIGQTLLRQPRTCRLDHSGLKAPPRRRQGPCHIVELDDVSTLRVAPLRLPSGPIAHELNHEGVADGGLGHEHERPWNDLDARQHRHVLDGIQGHPRRHRPKVKGSACLRRAGSLWLTRCG